MLVAAGAYYPDDHVIHAVRRRNERRADCVPRYTPSWEVDGRWTGCSNAESKERVTATPKRNICALVSSIRGWCVKNVSAAAGNISPGYRRSDAAQVTAIKQIRITIFTHDDQKARRGRAGYVHEQWAGATYILVGRIELGEPVGRRPKIIKGRKGLKANHRFAAIPGPSSIPSVTGGNEHIGAVTGHSADTPYATAVGAGVGTRGPCRHAGWIIY